MHERQTNSSRSSSPIQYNIISETKTYYFKTVRPIVLVYVVYFVFPYMEMPFKHDIPQRLKYCGYINRVPNLYCKLAYLNSYNTCSEKAHGLNIKKENIEVI